MTELKKATLQEISSDKSAKAIGEPFSVQFNPNSLKLKLSNKIEGGKSRGRQARQYLGSSSTVLSLELVFDTADEGMTGTPRSVREKTAIFEKYIKPKPKNKQAPPKLRFQWGRLIILGIAESVNIDFDHFAPDGTPLRAKVSLSINEQDHKYQFDEIGAGAKKKEEEQRAGQPGSNTAGSTAVTVVSSSAPALANETPPEFAARMGLDPAAWRGLAADGLNSGLALEAGVDVGFNESLKADLGVGIHVGVEAGVDISLEASFGLEANASISAGFSASAGASVDADLAAGFALSAAGGVGAALKAVQNAKAESASDEAREAFGLSATGAAATKAPQQPVRPNPPRKPLMTDRSRSLETQEPSRKLSSPLEVDTRAMTYGAGVPLRPRFSGAAEERKWFVEGSGSLKRPWKEGQGLFRDDPTKAPWIRLPKRDEGRRRADEIQQDRRRKPCGCMGPCTHRGGY